VIDVVDHPFPVADVHQHLQDRNDVLATQGVRITFLVAAGAADGQADPPVELHASDSRQVIALGIEEQVLEQILRGVLGRRLARPHHPVDLYQRVEASLSRVDAQRI
jgi:hypothetical protein